VKKILTPKGGINQDCFAKFIEMAFMKDDYSYIIGKSDIVGKEIASSLSAILDMEYVSDIQSLENNGKLIVKRDFFTGKLSGKIEIKSKSILLLKINTYPIKEMILNQSLNPWILAVPQPKNYSPEILHQAINLL